MALNINTKLTNNLDGYLLDAKNVKGTYVVVSNYSDLANLPSACVVKGTLAYVSNDGIDATENNGFWQYNGSNWIKKELELSKVYISVSDNDIDFTQTYTFTINGNNILKILQGALLYLSFNDAPVIAFASQFIVLNNGHIQNSILFAKDNKQYIALLDGNATSQSNNATLTFQELQAGSGGGGGAGSTKTLYHIEVEDSNDNKAIIPIYKDDFDKYLVEFNQIGQAMATSMGETWTTLNTIAEFKTLFDTQKTTQYAFGCDLGMNLLVKYAYESGENPVLQLSIQDDVLTNNDLTISNIASYDLTTYAPTIILGQVKSLYNNVESSLLVDYVWFKVSPNYSGEQITIDSNATFTYTEEQVSGGGGSSEGSGDGSIYTFRIKINTPPVYEPQGSFSTIDEYVGYYIYDNNEYILVTNDNKNSLGIVPNTTLYYEQNTLPNTPYSYLYFDINEVYFNDSNVIKDLNAILEMLGASTLDSLDDLPTYWNSVDISAKSFLVNTISSMGNNFKREFGNNDFDEDGFYSVANYTYLSSSSGNNSITWHGYTLGNSTYTDLSSYANDGIMEYVGKTGGSGGSSEAGSGSGKLYVYEFTLDTYDSNGKVVANSGKQFQIGIYESNFERLKVLVSGTDMALNSPQDIVTLINSFNETTISQDFENVAQITQLVASCDIKYAISRQGIYNPINADYILTPSIYYAGSSNNKYIGLITTENYDEVAYGLNSNNSCTLTEYGTSGSGSGGGSQPVASSGVDYVQIHSGGADNCLIFTFEKGMMDTPTMVANINAGITGLNTQLGLSIPAYTELSDLTDICTYINSLSSSYLQVKVIFWASMFNFMSYVCLNVKGQINGEICPISIEAVADSNNNNYTFAIKYLSANSNPLGYVEWFSPTTWLSPEPSVLVNQLD